MPHIPHRSRPRIGISMDTGCADAHKKVYELNAHYPDAILRAGGLPVLLPHSADSEIQRELVADLDALLIPGGADVDPALYQHPRHAKTQLLDPLRQTFDLALLAFAEERRLPLLGICLGCQLMNVHRHGTLHQSLADAFPESPVTHARSVTSDHNNPTRSSFHDVTLRPGTTLHAIYRTQFVPTNSRHRQAVNVLGRGLIASAFAPDGILEALEDPSLPYFVGVQWHPENLPASPHDLLFRALVAAAEEFRDASVSSAAAPIRAAAAR